MLSTGSILFYSIICNIMNIMDSASASFFQAKFIENINVQTFCAAFFIGFSYFNFLNHYTFYMFLSVKGRKLCV